MDKLVRISIRDTVDSRVEFATAMSARGWNKLGLENTLGYYLRKNSMSGLQKTALEVFRKNAESNEVISVKVEPDINYSEGIAEIEEIFADSE